MTLFMKNIFIIIFPLISIQVFAQAENINQYDQEGKRHGEWKKYYNDDGKNLRYEGKFQHGKEVGTFKFYKPNSKGKPAATKTYVEEHDSIHMKFFTKKGRLESEGNLIDKDREGVWKYYKNGYKDNLMMTENYQNGKLHGWKIIYFPDGKIMEKTYYQKGKKEGDLIIYAENGEVLQEYRYKNNKLHGNSKVYNSRGQIISEGAYKQGHRDGKWRYYTEGKLDSIQKFPLPDPVKKKKRLNSRN